MSRFLVLSFFRQISQGRSLGAFSLRIGIVGGNFVVMLGLAAGLGLEKFGALSVLWGLVMVGSTLVSLGGPLLLLRDLGGGTGMTARSVVNQVFIYPLGLAGLFWATLQVIGGDQPWAIIVIAAVAINALACLASIMRALGSVQMSMLLRDAGPFVSLGVAGFAAYVSDTIDPIQIILVAATLIAAATAGAAGFCLLHTGRTEIIDQGGVAAPIAWGLWGTSVLGMALAQVDIIIGGRFLASGEVGLYALLRRVANLVALPVTVATWVTAPEISVAFRHRDQAGLENASRRNSSIALLPGLVLLLAAITMLPVVVWVAGQDWAPTGTFVFLLLLAGAFGQVFFAANLTVSTLCGQEHFSLLSRLISVVLYLTAVAVLAPYLTLQINAAAYVVAMSCGSGFLWVVIRKRLQLDTSAAALWLRSDRKGVRQWNPF